MDLLVFTQKEGPLLFSDGGFGGTNPYSLVESNRDRVKRVGGRVRRDQVNGPRRALDRNGVRPKTRLSKERNLTGRGHSENSVWKEGSYKSLG